MGIRRRTGSESFRDWFADYADQYVIIGGTACDLLMDQAGLEFRATRDIDMVLLTEKLDLSFAQQFWKYIQAGGYKHQKKDTGESHYYRFDRPRSREFPYMIELFAPRSQSGLLPPRMIKAPFDFDVDISGLSAILLDDDQYHCILNGAIMIEGLPILSAGYLIPLKINAWTNLVRQKQEGVLVQSKDISKHKNDVFRLCALLTAGTSIPLPESLHEELYSFLDVMASEVVNLEACGLTGQNKLVVIDRIRNAYRCETL